jgi:hypothetical protein
LMYSSSPRRLGFPVARVSVAAAWRPRQQQAQPSLACLCATPCCWRGPSGRDQPLALVDALCVASLRRREWERKRRKDRFAGEKSVREKVLVEGLKRVQKQIQGS